MLKPAARVGDMHTCPMSDGPKPHVGGPVAGPGISTVIAQGAPVAVMSDIATCNGPPDIVVAASSTVFAGGLAVARMGDSTAHGGVIVAGSPLVLVGGPGSSPQVETIRTSERPFCELCHEETPPSNSEQEAPIEDDGEA